MWQPRPQEPWAQSCLHCGPAGRVRDEAQWLRAQGGPPNARCPLYLSSRAGSGTLPSPGRSHQHGRRHSAPRSLPQMSRSGARGQAGESAQGGGTQPQCQQHQHSQKDSPGRAAGSEGPASPGGSGRSRSGGRRTPHGHSRSSDCSWDPKYQQDMALSNQVRASLWDEGTVGWVQGWGQGPPRPQCAPTFLAEAGAVERGAGEGMLAGAAP